jgi:hypothetical protein
MLLHNEITDTNTLLLFLIIPSIWAVSICNLVVLAMSYKAVGDGEVKRGHGSKVVIHSPCNLKIKGLNLVTSTGKEILAGH